MKYKKKLLSTEDLDAMRVNLSVQDKKFGPEPHCDFCGDPNPTVIYAAHRLSTGEWKMNWRWCACDACSHAVDVADWKTIEDKLVGLLGRVFDHSEIVRRAAAKMALDDLKYLAIG